MISTTFKILIALKYKHEKKNFITSVENYLKLKFTAVKHILLRGEINVFMSNIEHNPSLKNKIQTHSKNAKQGVHFKEK